LSPTFLQCANFEIHIRGLGSPVSLQSFKILCFSGGKTISIVKFDEEFIMIGQFLRLSPLEMSIMNLFVPSQGFSFPTFLFMLTNTEHVFVWIRVDVHLSFWSLQIGFLFLDGARSQMSSFFCEYDRSMSYNQPCSSFKSNG
jgi:hypothetical protein